MVTRQVSMNAALGLVDRVWRTVAGH